MNQRSHSITCLRVLSMILIVLCHSISYYTFIPWSAHLNQFLSVGVQVFLLISGYLYGRGTITNYRQWIYGRANRIWLPVAIVVLVDVSLMYLIKIKTDLFTFVMYLLNLHGLLFLNWFFFRRFIIEIKNLGPLWFTTIIMICYMIVPLLQYIYQRVYKATSNSKN